MRGVATKDVCKAETVLYNGDAIRSEGQGVAGVVVVTRVVVAILEETERQVLTIERLVDLCRYTGRAQTCMGLVLAHLRSGMLVHVRRMEKRARLETPIC